MRASLFISGIGNNTDGEFRQNPDQAASRLKEQKTLTPVLNASGAVAGYNVVASTVYGWEVLWRKEGSRTWTTPPSSQNTWYEENGQTIRYPAVWIRLTRETTNENGAQTAQHLAYDGGEFGNLERVEEWGDGDLLLETRLDYYPNTIKHITNLPARVRIFDRRDGADSCVAESRTRYGQNGNGLSPDEYTEPPELPLPARVDQARGACGGNGNWSTEILRYDAYGNVIEEKKMGGSTSPDSRMKIVYDGNFGHFPLGRKMYNSEQAEYETIESVAYFGVASGPALSDPYAFFAPRLRNAA